MARAHSTAGDMLRRTVAVAICFWRQPDWRRHWMPLAAEFIVLLALHGASRSQSHTANVFLALAVFRADVRRDCRASAGDICAGFCAAAENTFAAARAGAAFICGRGASPCRGNPPTFWPEIQPAEDFSFTTFRMAARRRAIFRGFRRKKCARLFGTRQTCLWTGGILLCSPSCSAMARGNRNVHRSGFGGASACGNCQPLCRAFGGWGAAGAGGGV